MLWYPVGTKNRMSNPTKFRNATKMLSSSDSVSSVVLMMMSLGFFLVKSKFWMRRSRSFGRPRIVETMVYSVPF